MKRIYHHHDKWEEHKYGMWRKVSPEEEKTFFDWAVTFTGNTELYGAWMMKVVEQWRYSCEQNLSNRSINRQAWIGHAACALANECPEYIVRLAWWQLTEEQRVDANKKADKAIATWEEKHRREVRDAKNRARGQLSLSL